jgi:histidine ammonia-lyase
VLSHACGVGDFLEKPVVALVMLLKLKSLCRGYSGISRPVIERLLHFINNGLYPAIPEKGSVGASGDLAPLAHLACCLIGEGQFLSEETRIDSEQVLAHAGLEPLKLGPKEGLALLNGTNVSTALALKGLFEADKCLHNGIITGALTVDAALGSMVPFDARIQEIRGHAGQIDVAACYRDLLTGSSINDSHADCDRVQDPYSLRCQPQVMGACLDQIRHASKTIMIEANAVSDNPLVFSDSGDILSGGNFHAEPVAMASDILAIALSEIGAIAERRISLLLDKHLSNLPPFLVENSGLNSGFMIAQVTAAALASENKTLAHPASIDSLPTSANQEDHVSMATFAARRLSDIAENVTGILAIEALCAAQGIDFRSPLKPNLKLQKVMQTIRSRVSFYDQDRYLAPDIAQLTAMLQSEALITASEINSHNLLA